MHNTGASFVAAVFFTKSKSSMLEVAYLEMCRCRDCVRGNPYIVSRFALLGCNQVGKRLHAAIMQNIPKLSSEQVQLLNFKDISVRNNRSLYMIFNLQPLKYCLVKLSCNSCQGLNEIGMIFFFCFQLACSVDREFISLKQVKKCQLTLQKLEITVSFVHN